VNLTRDSIVDYVKQSLGWPLVDIELEDSHLDQAIDDTLMLFNQYLGEMQHRAYYSCADSYVLDMEADVRGVCEVRALFPESSRVYSQLNIFDLLYRLVYPQLPIGDWYMLRTFYEQFQYIRGVEPDWVYDEFNRRLYVDCHGGPWDLHIVVVKDLVDVEVFEEGFKGYRRIFLDSVTAYSKRILSKVRGKFAGTIPAPGGTLATDADRLEAEATEALAKTEDILEREAALVTPIIYGR